MAYIPRKSKRKYIDALWKLKADGTRGDLMHHRCCKCRQFKSGKENGAWFEHMDKKDVWLFVCNPCVDKIGR